ncbi:LOW QUALITY PROTEIN: hypothetical protein NC653_032574 [Populus alba x Populus x berolinensis]|uniref:Uncharacterized protein n=1 Tax=Populus alba x Populus x berolinensis TaxID=444605 RepID=A0AAD6LSW6_9ROSI|nr:LOW QUALITY PROTEIN: hypothetical protein NC653_032574 [Populus alba x Populus x berolinensis]
MSAGDLNNHSIELKFPSITMQGQKESPPDMQCKDKFLLQSVVAPDGTTTKDINFDMFNKEDGSLGCGGFQIDEESDEGSSPSRPSVFENGDQDTSLLDAVSKSLEEPKEKSSETWSMISRLTEEKLLPCLQQNQKLRHALELMRKQISKKTCWGCLFIGCFSGLVCLASWLAISSSEYPSD